MFYYIYDSFLAERKYDRTLAVIETRLTDLGISGKIGRLTPFTNAKGLIRDETKRGVETVVVVGNDETISKVVAGIGDNKITLGIIPVGSPNEIAQSLGIPEGVEACDVLSRRITKRIDLGRVNGRFFLSEVRIPQGKVVIEGDGNKYKISPIAADCQVIISNLRSSPEAVLGDAPSAGDRVGNPQDGLLDTLIVPRRGGFFGRSDRAALSSIFPMKRLSIKSEEPVAVSVDGTRLMSSDISIDLVPDQLKIITGRGRIFAV